ncbi:hypothetical protein VFPPC_09912 [Pochonia chlamydosporia 170]|uniref:Uncharacterized protein n=1 Tax=Pochonia chlamydosporia 170 TaxID=1380566 RepID=A0A179FD15_METCM|nr:hypothetical protein VFPPC_09912 [Pochonia chlamydosporia 170]OAQ63382.2 hypothetical protein VFPPC_09912 [Pochonia chlamydosporia 170]
MSISCCGQEEFAKHAAGFCLSESSSLQLPTKPFFSALESVVSGAGGWKLSSIGIFCLNPPALLAKELDILAILSFLITVEAELLTKRSLRDRTPIPGKGRISRLHTSARMVSKRARSLRAGARNDTRAFVVSNE